MKSGVPWQVIGVGRQARESAREAARRAGMPGGDWLDTGIRSSAPERAPIRPGAQPERSAWDAQPPAAEPEQLLPAGPAEDRRALGQDLANVNDRLDALARRLDQFAQTRLAAAQQDAPDPALPGGESIAPQAGLAARPPSPLDQALSEIAERQRALEGFVPADDGDVQNTAPRAPEPLPRAHTQERSGLEQQLREINSRIEGLRQSCGIDQAVESLREDLAEIGLMLQKAMPRTAVDALEADLRKLSERLDQTRDCVADGAVLAAIERGLAEVRDALHELTPAENLVELARVVQALAHRIDAAGSVQDPSTLRKLEEAILGMRRSVAHVASGEALAALSEEVRALAAKVDQAVAADGAGVLATIEQRIAALADALEARNNSTPSVPDELEANVKRLIDKIERIELTRGDPVSLGRLDDRLARFLEKLDASDVRLDHLEAIERGLADLLIHLEHHRSPAPAQARYLDPPEAEFLSREFAELKQTERKTQDALDMVRGTLGQLVDRLSTIESDLRNRSAAPPDARLWPIAPAAKPSAAAAAFPPAPDSPAAPGASRPLEPAASQPPGVGAPAATPHRAIDPNLPPDQPLEPGVGAPRGRNPGSLADRIAASEVVLAGASSPDIPDAASSKSNFIAAARRAAQAADRAAQTKIESGGSSEVATAAGRLAKRMSKLRALIGGTSSIVLVLISIQIARTMLGISDQTEMAAEPSQPALAALQEPAAAASPAPQPADVVPALPLPGLIVPLEAARPATMVPPASGAGPSFEITGSIPPPAKPAAAPPSPPRAAPAPATAHAPSAIAAEQFPATFGSALRAAAAKGDPAAQYEVALRYAEARGVAQNLAEAASWFERAANQGLAPAQFRLGGLHEKGLGVKKNIDLARRYYSAAGAAGNAKALHNLAVLHAEGVDGKPDYPTAARWFRKAADYGITDSQYNLAVLYARGIGVQSNMAEAYKWFALAAREGDAEAARKRDEIAARLDPRSLTAATLAVESWKPQPQPDPAVQVRTPAEGWDAPGPPAPPATSSKRKPRGAGSQLDLAPPSTPQ